MTNNASPTLSKQHEDRTLCDTNLPYRIESIDSTAGTYIVYFAAPSELIEVLIARPVLTRGSFFDILPAEVNSHANFHSLQTICANEFLNEGFTKIRTAKVFESL